VVPDNKGVYVFEINGIGIKHMIRRMRFG